MIIIIMMIVRIIMMIMPNPVGGSGGHKRVRRFPPGWTRIAGGRSNILYYKILDYDTR